ncbi:MAG: hypothetical protein AAF085_12120, partial [Planctomycetota bacterium]
MSLLADTLYRPGILVGIIVIVLVVVVLCGCFAMRRERRILPSALRLIAVLALGWVLLGYSQTTPSPSGTATLPKLSILVDSSLSMAEQDAVVSPDSPAVARLQAVSDAYFSEAILSQLRAVADVEINAFDDQVQPASAGGVLA